MDPASSAAGAAMLDGAESDLFKAGFRVAQEKYEAKAAEWENVARITLARAEAAESRAAAMERALRELRERGTADDPCFCTVALLSIGSSHHSYCAEARAALAGGAK